MRLAGLFAGVFCMTATSPASLLRVGAARAQGAPAGPPMLEYVLIPDSSRVRVLTHKSGLFRFAGHEHTIAMTGLTGSASVDPTDLTRFRLDLQAPAASFEVVDPAEDRETRAKVQKNA
jgi:hypothetical protein